MRADRRVRGARSTHAAGRPADRAAGPPVLDVEHERTPLFAAALYDPQPITRAARRLHYAGKKPARIHAFKLMHRRLPIGRDQQLAVIVRNLWSGGARGVARPAPVTDNTLVERLVRDD